jgi:FtsH-binding integral membrane protein
MNPGQYNTYAEQPIQYDLGLREFMLGVFNNMSLGLAISAVIAFFVGTSQELLMIFFGGPQKYVVMFAPLVFVFFFSFGIASMKPTTARLLFFVFAAVMGLSLATIFAVFKMGSIANAFFSTAAMFGAMSLYGYTTKRDLTNIGAFLIMGAMGLCIASVINIFMQSSILALAVSCLAVIIFSGLTAFDVQNLKNIYYELDEEERAKAGILGALSLYLNFINIFTSMLQIFGEKKD